MKSLFEDVQEVAVPRKKLVGRVVLGLLLLAAALVGTTGSAARYARPAAGR